MLSIPQKMKIISEVEQEINCLKEQNLSLEEVKNNYERLLNKMTDANFLWFSPGVRKNNWRKRVEVRNRLSEFGMPAAELMGFHLRNTLSITKNEIAIN